MQNFKTINAVVTSITYSQGNTVTVLLQLLLYNTIYINLIDKRDDDDCLASANLDVVECDNNVIMADVNGTKLPPKLQPNVGEIKLLPAAECEKHSSGCTTTIIAT